MGIISESKPPDVNQILSFLRTGNPRRTSTAGDGRETVTSSAPGLAPSDRLAVEKFMRQRQHTDTAVAEKENADKALLADGERETTNFEQQVGRPLSCTEVQRRLKVLNEKFMFERSNAFPDIMGIYLPDDTSELRNGVRKRHIVGFEFGYSPEYTVWHPQAEGPKKVTRGWRSLIILLAAHSYINFTRACRVFEISNDKNSLRWKQETAALKRGA
jgi:hypothetical protein